MKPGRLKTPGGRDSIQCQLGGASSSGETAASRQGVKLVGGGAEHGWTSAPACPSSQGLCKEPSLITHSEHDHGRDSRGQVSCGPCRVTTISAFAAFQADVGRFSGDLGRAEGLGSQRTPWPYKHGTWK